MEPALALVKLMESGLGIHPLVTVSSLFTLKLDSFALNLFRFCNVGSKYNDSNTILYLMYMYCFAVCFSAPQIAVLQCIHCHHTNWKPLIMIMYFSTAIDCGPLDSPENGTVFLPFGTAFGSFALYSCFTGYNLVGSSFRTCLASGNWSGSAPTCQSKT